MRVRKIPAVALVVLAAGLSLTACNGNGNAGDGSGNGSAGGSDSGAAPTSSSAGPSSSAPTAVAPAATGAARSTMCRTANLSFSSSHGMAEGEVLINLANIGHSTCTMHGFPGVDLKGKDGTVSAARSTVAAPDVTLRPGQATRFTLHYPPNTSGGTGATFTTLIITPPNETHSHPLPLTLNLPVTADPTPQITVDPVGAGK